MKEVNASEAMRLLTLAVMEKGPGYRYRNPQWVPGQDSGACLYVHRLRGRDVPGCVVANMMHRAGMPLAAMRPSEGRGVYMVANIAVNAGFVDADWQAQDIMSAAQNAQDDGRTWEKVWNAGSRAFRAATGNSYPYETFAEAAAAMGPRTQGVEVKDQ